MGCKPGILNYQQIDNFMQNKNRKISEFEKLKKTRKTEIFTKIT